MRTRGRVRFLTGVGLGLTILVAGSSAAAGAGGPRGWQVTQLPFSPGAPSSFSEPGVAAGTHGVLLENACTANTGSPSTFWLSRSYGRAWSRGFPVGESAVGCGDADAAVGADGYLYSLTLGSGVEVYRSPDGKTWHGPASFPPPHGVDQPDRPWLVLVPHHPNEVLVFNSEVGGNIVVWRSVDRAATFSGPVLVSGGPNSQAALALSSRPLVDPTDPARMSVLYETAGPSGLTESVGDSGPSQFPLTQLWDATSVDGGLHWTNSLVLDVTTAFRVGQGSLGHVLPATTVDRAGTSYAVLSVRLAAAAATHLYLIHSLHRDAWSRPVRIDRAGGSNVLPAVAAAGPGRLFVSWYASAAADFNDPHAHWAEMFATTPGALTTHPTFTIRRLSGRTPVHVGGVDDMGAVGFDLGENWGLRDFQSVTVDRCGHPHVTWAADATGRRTYAATTMPFCLTRTRH